MALLEIRNVSMSYGGSGESPVLRDINLDLEKGEMLAILGFSGSGKTTLISLIAGLIRPQRGTIIFRGKELLEPGPDRGVVFQSYSLLPWLTVEENVLLAVEQACPGERPKALRERARGYVELVRLGHASKKKPPQLSGGMRQRVALARALALEPELLLLDEPLGALDALTRASLQDELERIWLTSKKTAILVTNDVDEAIRLADRIAILSPGSGSTISSIFPVTLDRPRDRKHLSSLGQFKELREAIIKLLLSYRPNLKEGVKKTPPRRIETPEPVDLNAGVEGELMRAKAPL